MVRGVAVLLLGLVGFVGAQLADHFAARGALLAAKAELAKGTSLKATYYAKQIAESLKDAASCDCGKLSTLLAKESDALEIFYGLSAAKACKCSDVKLSASQKEQIQQGLESSELAGLAGAALAGKMAGLPLEGKSVVEKILDLSTPDGTFKSDSGVPGKGSLKNAKLALQALSVLGAAAGSNSKLEKVLEGALQLLPSGEADGDSTVVDPTLLVYLKAQAEKRIKLKTKQVQAIAASLLALQHSDCLQTLSLAVEALQLVASSFKGTAPVVVRAGEFKPASSTLAVTVTDLFGEKAAVTSIEAKSVKRLGTDKAVATSLPVSAGKLDLSSVAEDLSSGRYVVELSIETPDLAKATTASVRFVVTRELAVSKVHAGISDAKQVSANELSAVGSQNKWSGGAAASDAGDIVHVLYNVEVRGAVKEKKFIKPHQSFVKFTHVATGADSFFVGSAVGDAGAFKAAVSLSKEVETLGHRSGEYTVSILVADVTSKAPVEFVLGSLEISVPAKVDKISPLYTTSLLHASDNSLQPLPEIEHKMRPPAKRASIFMSTLFTLLALAPLAAFGLYVLAQSPNIARFTAPSTFLFVALIGAALVLYVAYWLALPGVSFYDTIKYICFLVPATAIAGRSAINVYNSAAMEKVDKKEG